MTFSYHRSVAPMMWVFVGLASIELVIVHLLVALFWSRLGALVLSIVTLATIGWLVVTIASMRRLPVTLDREQLVMRVGSLRRVAVPIGRIAGLRLSWEGEALKRPGVLNLALIAYPNVVIDLTEPMPGRQGIRSIAHRLDDPAAFAAAIEQLGAQR